MENLDYEIIGYEYHSHTDPNLQGFLVRFLVTDVLLNRQNAFESIIKDNICVGKTEHQIVQLAYNKIKSDVKIWHDSLPQSNIVGSKFIPSK